MPMTHGNAHNVNALDFALSMHADLDAAFYNVKHPEHDWGKVVNIDQVKCDISSGATVYAYQSRDSSGTAAFVGNGPASNIPQVAQSFGLVNVPVAAAAIGAAITNEDARQYTHSNNKDLILDSAHIMRKGADNLVERVVFYGDEGLGFTGFLNYPGMTVINAADNGSGKTTWADKTPEQILKDINDLLTNVWENSKTVFMPNVLFIPPAAFGIIAQTPMTLGGTSLTRTILEHVKTMNLITAQSGKALEIEVLRHLAGAGVGGTSRMIVQDRSPDYQVLPFPMPYTLAEPVPAPLAVELYAEFKIGGYHMRQPRATAAMDGI